MAMADIGEASCDNSRNGGRVGLTVELPSWILKARAVSTVEFPCRFMSCWTGFEPRIGGGRFMSCWTGFEPVIGGAMAIETRLY